MSENKVKLQLSRNLSDKSPSPTKLMLNHGKPNFTINRQNSNYKKYHIDTDLKSNEIDKVVLKNVTPSADKENFNVNMETDKNQDQEFIEKFKKISIKMEKSEQNKLSNTKEIKEQFTQKQEFLDKFKEIADKLSTRDIDSIETTQSLDNTANDNINNGNSVYNMKPYTSSQLSKPLPEFAKIVDNRLQNANINNSGFKLPPGAICGKPYIPVKPPGLIPTVPTVLSNGNGIQISPSPKNDTTTSNNENNCPDIVNGSNFEQKTIVSFSKDLSAAPNSYPDTAKKTVINEMKSNFHQKNEMGQLKFDIKTTDNDVIVKQVIR